MSTQKIALFGATGEVGERLTAEALKKGYNVTAVVGNESDLKVKHPNLTVIKGEVKKPEDVSKHAKGHNVVVAFHEPTRDNPREHVETTRCLIEGCKKAGVNHLVAVGHSTSKWAGNTQQAYDAYKPIVQAQRDALSLFKNERELNWSYARNSEPEKSQGNEYRMSSDILFTHPQGEHRIQPKDLTNAVLEEAEKSEMELHEQHDDEEL